MKTIKKLATLLVCIASLNSFAQEVIIENDNITTSFGLGEGIAVGQSFTATVTGTITKIEVVCEDPSVASLIIYNGASATDGILHTQSVNLTNTYTDNSNYTYHTVILDTPVPIVSGNVYYFDFGIANLFFDDSNSYPSGNMYIDGSAESGEDLTFRVVQEPTAPSNTLNFQSSGSNLVTIPDNAAFDFSSGFTMEAWIKPSVFTTSRTVFSQYSSGQRAFAIITKDAGSVEVTISTNGNDEVYYITANALTLNTWQHIALTYDNSSIKFYINGIEAGINGSVTGTLTGAMHNSTADIVLGARSSAIFYSGDMDQVRIWTYALTSTEVNSQKNVDILANTSGLVAYYKMDQGTAGGDNTGITTLTDSGVNGLSGTLTSFTRTGATSNFVAGIPVNSLSVNESIFSANEIPVVYPNPINDGIINVKVSNTLLVNNKKLSYKIYNTVGRIIKEGVLTDVENKISVGYLASGIYMVRISNNENAVVKKLVVK